MLKIKDNIPLTELEKFDFCEIDENWYQIGSGWEAHITVRPDRRIKFGDEWWGEDFNLMDLLYDLIKADMVEKVEN
jgi:hypothetical protein